MEMFSIGFLAGAMVALIIILIDRVVKTKDKDDQNNNSELLDEDDNKLNLPINKENNRYKVR